MKKNKPDGEGAQTKAIHADHEWNRTRAVSPPIWQTTSFRADSSEEFAEVARRIHPDEFYTRYGNPTHKQVEATLIALEGGEAALVVSSGMGAIFAATMSILESGDHVVAQEKHYAGTTTLFHDVVPRWGIECTYVEQTDVDAFAAAIRLAYRINARVWH